MVRLVLSNEKMITLTRGNKTIKRSEVDYKTNKKMYDFRGFKVAEDLIKDKDDTILEFEPKVKNAKTKRTRSKSKKKIKEDL
jgi:hypothetical protein|tara:strand:- start:1847 stop:2092 length:246 start_codon:yes stop_codon:yes gene_type:complete